MLPILWKEQLKQRNLLIWMGLFVVVLGFYTVFDFLGQESYAKLLAEFGVTVLVVHIFLNVGLAFMTSTMLSLTQINVRLNRKEPAGSTSIPVLSFFFALFTFGCTPCVVAFLAAVGIAFTPLVFPLGNLMWKVILLGLILLAMAYMLYVLHKGTCTPKLKTDKPA